ncbi:H-2 class I histocompatibility antigen, Q10 alpha chain-like isoform X2 [Ctenopharyngodon idella]|uniref:H-2 class I histocompatibility antigen, Q10 alpha chain-like isoform X2 n=1 Tax=Ctenopharyngodon idella TaxID=7959 RepID=UPI002232383A|nr:H-2 class I histocompatibility antigen, Q10 alpha chain-like isoform X2 [Ctenopharyngodon idella]
MATSLLCSVFFFFCGTSASLQAEGHSLYYIYTGLSKPVDLPSIYQFSAMGLLDDRQIDYYNSKEKRTIPKQPWMKEKLQEDYWEKSTQSRKGKEQWFNVNVHIMMDRMKQSESGLHVFQWITGCETEQQEDEMKFSRGIYEFSYDGENFLSFDIKESQWVAPVDAAVPTKTKWDNQITLNQYFKRYLEKECVDGLNKYREYADEELRNSSPPDVHFFARKSIKDETMLKLNCLATGFYPKDVMMTIRKYRIPLPENETESTIVRPNHDGSFQMRMSVEIKKDDEAEYDCFLSHSTFEEPIINKWDGKCPECLSDSVRAGFIGGVGGGVFILALAVLVFCILVKKYIIVFRCTNPNDDENAGVPLQEVQSAETSDISAASSVEHVSECGLPL